MTRATLIAAVDEPSEVEAYENWLAEHGALLEHRSEEQGCGCCVLITDVTAPDSVIATIPDCIKGASPWSMEST